MYPRRDFDLVTVSVKYPDEKTGVMKVRNEQHASSRDVEFAIEDAHGLPAAFEPKPNADAPFWRTGSNDNFTGHPAHWAQK